MSPHRESATAAVEEITDSSSSANNVRKRQVQLQQEQANGNNGHVNAGGNGKDKNAADDDMDEEERRAQEHTSGSGSAAVSVPTTGILSYPPFSWIIGFYNMFFTWKFLVHRQVGLYFLVQWAVSLFLYFYDYPTWRHSFLVWSLPLTATIQAITAALTFTFLSRNKADQGYFTDKYTMSYPLVVENSFFQLIALFQWLYYDPRFFGFLVKSFFIEASFVFFPYYFRDLYWPKTSFRDSYGSDDSNRSTYNKVFYEGAILLTKGFYIWAKHFMGFYLNYVRYLNRINESEAAHVYLGLIFGAFSLTVGMFLHTLKFKKMMDPRLSFNLYAASYLMTLYTFVRISEVFVLHADLTIITLLGLAINFLPRTYQNIYQVVIFALLASSRYGFMPEELHQYIGLRMGSVAQI